MTRSTYGLILAVCCGLTLPLRAQSPSLAEVRTGKLLTLRQAVDAALANYPSIQVSQEQMNAAAANIRLAQTAYLPRVDGLAQVNRATRNTFYGMLLPNNIIPGLDGTPANNLGSVWDSGAGVLITWQPFDLGLRHANVATAKASQQYAKAVLGLTRFDVSVATADAFLTSMAAAETARAAQAAIDSWEILLRSVHGLVSAQLRPGADESRIQSELAAARTQLLQAQEAIEVARSTVSQFVGVPTSQVELEPGGLLQSLPPVPASPATLNVDRNPLAVKQNAETEVVKSQLSALQHTYRPQFFLQGLGAARGTGFDVYNNGSRLGGANGLAPNVQNYALGLTVTFPVLDVFANRAQEASQAAIIRADQAQSQVIARDLRAQWDAAQATLTGARAIAANTPTEVSSAQAAVNQATAQYKAGLAAIDNLAQAQRLLVEAQIVDSIARLGVWRALLRVQTLQGDIRPFLSEAAQ